MEKLQALAGRGVGGEKAAAQRKVARLEARFDFSGSAPSETPDLFRGNFKRSATARRVFVFGHQAYEVANAVTCAACGHPSRCSPVHSGCGVGKTDSLFRTRGGDYRGIGGCVCWCASGMQPRSEKRVRIIIGADVASGKRADARFGSASS